MVLTILFVYYIISVLYIERLLHHGVSDKKLSDFKKEVGKYWLIGILLVSPFYCAKSLYNKAKKRFL